MNATRVGFHRLVGPPRKPWTLHRCGTVDGSYQPSGGLVRAQPELPDHAFAHDELLDLSGDGHRELIHESDAPRHRNALLAKMRDMEATLSAMDEVEQTCLGALVANAA